MDPGGSDGEAYVRIHHYSSSGQPNHQVRPLRQQHAHIHWLSPRSPQQPSITGLQVPACTSSWPLPEDLVTGTAETSVTYHFTWLCAMTYNMQPCQLCKQRQSHYSSKNRVSMCGALVLGLGVCQEGGSGGSEITRQNVPLWGVKLLRLGGGSSNLIFIFTVFFTQSAYFRVVF